MAADKNLMQDKRFWPIFWTQFLGAFNDNIFKNALVILITLKAFSLGGIPSRQLVALCGGIFILPFFLFSATAGQVADRCSKPKLIFWIKIWEIAAMLVGTVGFLTDHISLLLVTLFFMGLHSTFFGPVKYSILPQLLREEELVSGNAYVEMGTFIAILLGTILGGFLITLREEGAWLVSGAVVTVACLGCASSLKIQPLDPASPNLKVSANPFPPTLEMLKLTMRVRSIFLSILGISWFWFLGAAILSLLPSYCREFLKGEESVITLFLALFSVGVGAGSILCGHLSRKKLELGLVPIGSMGMSLFAFDLFLTGYPTSLSAAVHGAISPLELLATTGGLRIAADLFLLAVFGGLFIVPLYTLIQQRSLEDERSRVIAGNNIVNALFMVVSALILMLLFSLDVSLPHIFLLLSLMNLAVACYIYTVIPEFMFRFICWVIAHIMYRLKVLGQEHIPQKGAAVLICNHVSYIDWLIIASACPRPIRFVMHYKFLEIRLTRRIFQDAKVIPIAGSMQDPEILESAFERIAEELEQGEIVCIFPEGRITRDGKMIKFRPGIERIIQTTPVPVIPMALDGLWGSFFSKKYGKPMSKPFRRFWSRISLSIGDPIPPQEASIETLQERVAALKSDEE